MSTRTTAPELRQPHEPREPVTAAHLLADLGLRRATVEEQRRGVAEWLATHQPPRMLARSLRNSGLM